MCVTLKRLEEAIKVLIIRQLQAIKVIQKCNTCFTILLIINALDNQYRNISMYRRCYMNLLHQPKFIYLIYRHLHIIMYHLCISKSRCKRLIINDINY